MAADIDEAHFMAALVASAAACELLDVLPQNDLILELKNIIEIQYALFFHILEGKHFGTDNLDRFMQYAEDVTDQALRIRQGS